MPITISTHLGTRVSLPHNRRDEDFIKKENENWAKRHPGEIRINPNGYKEIMVYRDLKESYDLLFSDALKKFNEKQIKNRNPERVIDNYLAHIQASEKKHKNALHPVYEMIYTVGSMNNPVEETASIEILRKVAKEFEARNPNFYIVCMALHCDEMGANHLHVSFIPVAHSTNNHGMATRNSLTKALEQQGLIGTSRSLTSQMLFEKQENAALEKICKDYGYEVIHPTVGQHREYLSVEEYRLKKSIEEKQAKLQELNDLPLNKKIINAGRLEQLENIEKKYKKYSATFEKNKRDVKAAKEAMINYTRMYQELEKKNDHIEDIISSRVNKKTESMKNSAFDFIKSLNLWEQFLSFSSSLGQSIRHVFKQ